MGNGEGDKLRDKIVIENITIKSLIICLMDQKVERWEVVEEGNAVKFRIGDGIDDGVDNGIIEIGFEAGCQKEIIEIEVDIKDTGGAKENRNIAWEEVKVVGEVGIVAEKTENIGVNAAIGSQYDGVKEGRVVKEEEDEVCVVKEEVIVDFVHVVLVDEVVEEGIAGEEFKDIGGGSEDTGVNLDDTIFGTVLGENIGEVGGEEGESCRDIAEEVSFGVVG